MSDNINYRILKLVEFVSLKSEITYNNWGNTQMCRQICSTVCGNFISFPLTIMQKKKNPLALTLLLLFHHIFQA